MASPNHPIIPPPNHPTTPSSNGTVVTGTWLLVLGALLLGCGLCAGAFYLVVPFFAKTPLDAIQTNVLVGAFAALGIGFGALFAWLGIATLRHRAHLLTVPLFPPTRLLVVFLLALVLGSGALRLEPIAALVFPPFHLLAAALLPLALLAYAAHRLNVTSGVRAFIVALGWGALGSTALAMLLEALIGVIMLVGISLAIALTPDGGESLNRLSAELRTLRALDEQVAVRFLLAHPGLIVLALIYFAGIVPLIEEAVKTLVLAFMDPLRTRVRDAVLWGMAAGAGFALVENILNSSLLLELWAVLVVARFGATIMHTATGMIMARGWYTARVERRWDKLFIAYAISVIGHALWNVFAAGQAVGIVGLLGAGRALGVESPWLWLNAAMLLGLATLTFGGIGWIVYAVRAAREPTTSDIEERRQNA